MKTSTVGSCEGVNFMSAKRFMGRWMRCRIMKYEMKRPGKTSSVSDTMRGSEIHSVEGRVRKQRQRHVM
jgi:hypothetical protein